MVQIDDVIFGSVSDDNKETPLLFLNAIANQRRNARIPVWCIISLERRYNINGVVLGTYTALRTMVANLQLCDLITAVRRQRHHIVCTSKVLRSFVLKSDKQKKVPIRIGPCGCNF